MKKQIVKRLKKLIIIGVLGFSAISFQNSFAITQKDSLQACVESLKEQQVIYSVQNQYNQLIEKPKKENKKL